MDKPNIIFLDIDGVINTTVSPEWNDRIFDQNSIKFLRMIQKECNTKFVISSTWRGDDDYLRFDQMLHVAGLGQMSLFSVDRDIDEKHTEWRTPYISVHSRGKEIEAWLAKYGDLINNYVIVDDETYDLLGYQLEKVVQTDHWCGITYREYDAIKRVLGYKNEGMATISEMRKVYQKSK
ncbi:MAG: hypothetical protein CL489_08345 [Acidobacteria bacterium]|nr:hypothetical protein [Acidobacteriota bacterium]